MVNQQLRKVDCDNGRSLEADEWVLQSAPQGLGITSFSASDVCKWCRWGITREGPQKISMRFSFAQVGSVNAGSRAHTSLAGNREIHFSENNQSKDNDSWDFTAQSGPTT